MSVLAPRKGRASASVSTRNKLALWTRAAWILPEAPRVFYLCNKSVRAKLAQYSWQARPVSNARTFPILRFNSWEA